MDSKLVNEAAERFRDRAIRLTPAVIARLGLIKKHILLRVEEFFITSVPYDLAIGRASLLAILSDREIAFFEKMKDRPQKLDVSRMSPYSSKPESFFLVSRILAFRKPAPASPYCYIDLEFPSPPLVYKEMLVEFFLEHDEARNFYDSAPDEALPAPIVEASLGSRYVSLLAESTKAEKLKIVGLSAKRLVAFGEFEGRLPAAGDALEFEPYEGDSDCLLKGTCSTVEPYAAAEGFALVDVGLEFSSAAHARMFAAVKKGRRTRPAAEA